MRPVTSLNLMIHVDREGLWHLRIDSEESRRYVSLEDPGAGPIDVFEAAADSIGEAILEALSNRR